ncbi:hypothetical protein BOTBODRAFT_483056 [Botryobasidium botryosum FD-172 SS1]|uniref:XPG N-terminal domain-containing protein n=1 Tax=Botryobasidium botryosum (strain FD-172 SS1) TaxID=930990 RepID=A0A067N4K2_BOTB1|nr:hypothetical protein BOTBODRAFT_483056 [Botryobasidium botryosum FD-172 SS1]
MTIKHLDQHLAERKHITTLPLSALADTRLGIDISFYLRQFLESNREPFLAATGGIPLTLTSVIEDDLRALEKLRIKPVFVFPGLLPNKRQKPNVNEHADACRDRREAWAAYEKGNADDAAKLFEGRSGISQWDLWRSVLRIFRHRNVDFVIAPYTSWAQVDDLRKFSLYHHAP